MADHTKIEWAEATANYINGCSVTSPGCTNCYAMRLAGTRMKHHPTRAGLTQDSNAGPVWTGEVRAHEPVLKQVLGWKRPRAIFWNAHGDLFHENVPDEWIDRQFAVMALTPQHRHMVLTKRSARMRQYLAQLVCEQQRWERLGDAAAVIIGNEGYYKAGECPWPLPNVWLGVSVEDQARADERIPDLLATPAAVRFLSCEPLLGSVNLFGGSDDRKQIWNWLSGETGTMHFDGPDFDYGPKLDWVIVGGESGPAARPMHPDWARSLRDQCAVTGIPFFFKQWGEWAPGDAFGMQGDQPVSDHFGNVRDWMNRYVVCEDRADRLRGHSFTDHATDLVYRVGKKRAGRLLDGVEHSEVPS